ncbi:MAG: 30S ribosomal protein S12 methylthiotransferase RimO [Bacteroidales bacterium]
MKTKSVRKKINIVTLGCSKNLVDSEVLMAQLRAQNIEVVHEKGDDANIVIINTCGFINDAKEESIETILDFVQAKDRGEIEKVYVMGCLSERYRDELKEEIEGVDGFYGVGQFADILSDLGVDYKKELLGDRVLSTPSHYAYLKISEGCDRRCSFCAIPLIRGKHISVPVEELVEEAKGLVAQGVKELILIAQDLNYYGLDLYGERRLGDLLNQLSGIPNLEWIRLHYTYPAGFPDDVLDLMAKKSNICNYIDIPLQHISEDLLKSMKRGASEETTRNLVAKFRSKVPDVALRTTFIVGYPGETEEDFQKLKQFVAETRFERMGVFQYSEEEGTYAATLDDDVPADVKQRRTDELMDLQQEISLEINKKKEGKIFKVLVDNEESDYFIGRTEFDSPEVDNEVLILKDESTKIEIGEFCLVKIIKADMFDIIGEICSDFE